jgi:hypothetical protein
MPPARSVRSVTGDPADGQIIVLAKGTRGPRVGGALVLGPSKKAPKGVLGIVTSRRRRHNGSLRLVTKPGTLDSAYKSFHAHLDTTLGAAESAGQTPGAARASSALGHFAPSFTCHGAALPHPITTHVDLSNMHLVLDVTTQPSIDFLVTGSPRFELGVAFSGTVTCTASAEIPIPVADTGIIVGIGPQFTFAAQGAVGAHFTWSPRMTFGYFRSAHSGNYDTHVFHNAGSVTFTGGASVDLYLALKTDITLGGRVGVGGTIGPDLNGQVASDSATRSTCFTVGASVKAQLTAFADVLFKHWTFSIYSGSFGNVEMYRSCTGGPPTPPPVALPLVRATMSWSTDSDIDLYTWDQEGRLISYYERYGIPDAELIEDVIPGLEETVHPPEIFQETANPNRTYTFGICDFRGYGANVTLEVVDPGGAHRTFHDTLYEPGDSAVITMSPSGQGYDPGPGSYWCSHIEEFEEEYYEEE